MAFTEIVHHHLKLKLALSVLQSVETGTAASTVVVGNSSSGNRDWRTKDGKPLLEFLK